ncbi:hemolysin family protein [Sulfuriflexus mobilis]|uniref:hemolysin family protein n=1 Tax=Sulfuriflexus mobilis TaxID=1811807 RepID=UPI001558CA40|nr:hemolysin family protein [Sulfuriflexus mobilis]
MSALLAVDPQQLLQADMIFRIGLQMLLMAASAFFSGSETALFSLSRLDLQQLRRERNPRFDTLQTLLERPRQLIISILCGNEIINIAATANMTGILVALYGAERGGVLSILVMVPLLLLFGEVTPKTIAVSDPVKISTRIIALPLSIWVRVITPFRWVIRLVADRLTTWLVGEETAAENILQVDEFRTLVDEVVKEGELSARERSLIYNLLEAGTTEVIEIMIPRTQTAFIDVETPVAEIVEQVRTRRYTRLPVFRGSRDNLVGFIHAEDILQRVLVDTDFNTLKIEDILHPPVIVPPTKKVDEMFDFFRDHKVQAAAILNEFGGVDGLVTLKSVLSFVFGKVTPETAPHLLYAQLAENVFEVAGDMKLTDFEDLTNFGITDPRMTTIGGIMLRALDRLPQEGDEITVEGVVLSVLEMKGHRIARLRASKGDGAAETTGYQEAAINEDTDNN